MVSKRTEKVRLRSRLPQAMDAKAWLQMVLMDQPARNRLGAMVMFEHRLHVVAWLGRQIHTVPLEHSGAGSGLHASLEPEDRWTLEMWLADVEAGRFSTIIDREQKKSPKW